MTFSLLTIAYWCVFIACGLPYFAAWIAKAGSFGPRDNQHPRDWAAKHGFVLFPEKSFESISLTCVSNGARPGGRTVDVAKLQKLVKDQGFLIDGGYGKIKGTTFRLSNMGDETEATMQQLYAALDNAMKQL